MHRQVGRLAVAGGDEQVRVGGPEPPQRLLATVTQVGQDREVDLVVEFDERDAVPVAERRGPADQPVPRVGQHPVPALQGDRVDRREPVAGAGEAGRLLVLPAREDEVEAVARGGVEEFRQAGAEVDPVAARGVVPARVLSVEPAGGSRTEPLDLQAGRQVVQPQPSEQQQRGSTDADGVVAERRSVGADGVEIGVGLPRTGPGVPGEVPQGDRQPTRQMFRDGAGEAVSCGLGEVAGAQVPVAHGCRLASSPDCSGTVSC